MADSPPDKGLILNYLKGFNMQQETIALLNKAISCIGLGNTELEKAQWLVDYAAQGAHQYFEDDTAEMLHGLAGFNGLDTE